MSPPSLASDQAAPPAAERTHARWFTDEVYPHEAQLKAHLRGSFPSVRDVDDVVQDSYLRIWKARASQPIQSAKSLLFTIARRLALNVIRKNSRSPVFAVTDLDRLCVLDNAPDAARAADTAQEVELLASAIDSLPARCREIFILRRLQSVPQKEIAARLGLSEETVQRQAANGLCRCEKFILRRLKDNP